MTPVVTPAEMAEVDANAPEPIDVLIERAGAAVAREALDLLGGAYGRRVVVLAGKGNNGADGVAAARRLERRGIRVTVVDAAAPPPHLPPADLVIDAGYGTGFRGEFLAPALTPVSGQEPPPVLAVDIPSGVSGVDGSVSGRPWVATRTITFAALKPGLLFEPGASYCGEVRVADIGLDVEEVGRGSEPRRIRLAGASDLTRLRRELRRPIDSHKWQRACWVIAGSAPMPGAAYLAAAAAMRAGSGYVRVSSPGLALGESALPIEAVAYPLHGDNWAGLISDPVAQASRFSAAVIGPGLGTDPHTVEQIAQVIAELPLPLVIDADALRALAHAGPSTLSSRSGDRGRATILTPHDGERAAFDHWLESSGPMDGDPEPTGCARIDQTVALAQTAGATALLKGPTTVVADPDGQVRLSRAGDQRLATAGTGDVLAGVIGALLAQGASALDAAVLGAELHGRAAELAALDAPDSMVASDLLEAIGRS